MFKLPRAKRHQNIARASKQQHNPITLAQEWQGTLIALQLAGELDFLFDKGDNAEWRLLCETTF